MLVITVIIGVLCFNSIDSKQRNDSTFFQRLSMLMIYELENPGKNPQAIIKPYEDQYSIFALLTDAQGNIVYQSDSLFPTDINLLLEKFAEKSRAESTTALYRTSSTTQNGILTFSGVSNDNYWGISAVIIDKNGTTFHLRLLQQEKTAFELIKKQLPFYILIWLISLLSIAIISRFLLRYAMKPTEKILKSQKDFIASVSHELKAPIAVILANNDKINGLSKELPDIQKATNVIDTELLHMTKLIKGMLFLASSDAGTRTIHKTMVNLDTLLITLYEAFEPVCSQKGFFLDADFIDNHFPELYTDRECVFQILSIFMDNAIIHSKTETSIKIKANLSRNSLTISIIDYGIGISEKENLIFLTGFIVQTNHTQINSILVLVSALQKN